jgi:hypothetical protein
VQVTQRCVVDLSKADRGTDGTPPTLMSALALAGLAPLTKVRTGYLRGRPGRS